MPVKVVAFVTAKPGADDAFIAAARTCVAASRSEPGTLDYELWREADGERRFVFNELYADKAAVEQHLSSDHFREFERAGRELWVAPPVIIAAHPIDVA